MSGIYFYKMTCDDGGAPCVQDGLLSLAICKPFIRASAKVGDLIFGFAANSLSHDNRLIYIAKITDKLCAGKYYQERRFEHRIDCIYERSGSRFVRRSNAKFHEESQDLVRDLGDEPRYKRANVLMSSDFRYFGDHGTADYKGRFRHIKRAIEGLARGHRVHLDKDVRREFLELKAESWRKGSCRQIGQPTRPPSRSACHRSRSCGVIPPSLIACLSVCHQWLA